jgi:multicomponent Na+:H+ antiporter subunit F
VTPSWVALHLALPILALAIVPAFLRLLKGPSLADRVIALDLIGTLAIGMICCVAVAYGAPGFVDVAIIIALLSFLGTVAFAHYLRRRTEP